MCEERWACVPLPVVGGARGVRASVACGLHVVGGANYVTDRQSGAMSSVPFR